MDLPGLFTEIALRHLWQGVVIIGIVSLLLSARRFWSAEHRSWIWTAGLILSAILPFLTLVELPHLGGNGAAASTALPAQLSVSQMHAAHPGAIIADLMAVLSRLVESLPLTLIISALGAIWLGVMVWKLFGIFSAARQTRALVETLEPCLLSSDMVPRDWPESIEILQSRAVGTPMAVGFFHCRVVLPPALLGTLPQHQIRHILSHELAHIRRGDLQFAMIQRIIEAVFWWSPLTWFIGARLREEREMACDDRAVQMNGCSRQYATALLESVTVLVAGRTRDKADVCHSEVLALSAFDHHSRSAFRARIRRLIGKGYQSRVALGRMQMASVSAAVMAIVAMFVLSPRGALDSGVIDADRPFMMAGMTAGMTGSIEEDKRVLLELEIPVPALLGEIAAAPQSVKIHQPRLAGFATASRPSPAAPYDATHHIGHDHETGATECTDQDRSDDGTGRNTMTASSRSVFRNRTGPGPHIEVEKTQIALSDLEAEIMADIRTGTDEMDMHSQTEIIVMTRNKDKTMVRRVIRHSDAQSITVTASDGSTMTVKIAGEANGTQLFSMGGGDGIVSIQ